MAIHPITDMEKGHDRPECEVGKVYASGIIATLENNHDVVWFDTSIGHAGEFIDAILARYNR